MDDFGEERSTSFRDAIGERDPALMFSFFGLGVCGLFGTRVEIGRVVFAEPAERLSVEQLLVTAARRPRRPGVLSRLLNPLRLGHEFPNLFTEFFSSGPL
jgi:hypothetical protein